MRFSNPVFCLNSGGHLQEVRISNLFPAPLHHVSLNNPNQKLVVVHSNGRESVGR
ncbi:MULTISPECIES: hypothetical protein [Okeania]|uniref:hypothetical protein n=1 Tax=Okeania TaxID=1458928 RepID=UPI00137518F5|nr:MULTISPECIES: hypothetical protein [Okeania]NET14323.1 hypothetical protein [Okeania sp. SIO1H6]NET23564.1 hypothetical protein [Okeania sp. SIO1H5]NET78009.1 hypothetical protein [Okeania sp. SIO1F9]NET96453.1 hypothetical protein [Okeania sp. SIO1H2]